MTLQSISVSSSALGIGVINTNHHHPALITKYILDISPITVSVRKVTIGMIDTVPTKGTEFDKRPDGAAEDYKAKPSTAKQTNRLSPLIGVIRVKK